jgi:hypothetical protein
MGPPVLKPELLRVDTAAESLSIILLLEAGRPRPPQPRAGKVTRFLILLASQSFSSTV